MPDKTEAIRLVGDKILQSKATNVLRIDDDIKLLVWNMLHSMYEHKGIGLAANQIGSPLNIAVIDLQEDGKLDATVLINPTYVYRLGRSMKTEGCLSVPGKSVRVPRNSSVGVDAFDLNMKPFRVNAQGLFATCLQHELDHLNGMTILDHVKKAVIVSCCIECRKYDVTLFNVLLPNGDKAKSCPEHLNNYQRLVRGK